MRKDIGLAFASLELVKQADTRIAVAPARNAGHGLQLLAGALRMVKVVPSRGPTYYVYDRDGDGKLDWSKGEAPMTYYKLYSW